MDKADLLPAELMFYSVSGCFQAPVLSPELGFVAALPGVDAGVIMVVCYRV